MRTLRKIALTSTLLVALAVPGIASAGNSWDAGLRGNSWDGNSWDGNSWDGNSWD